MNNRILSDIENLWRLSEGSPEICIAILDGAADLAHPCLNGARLKRINCLVSESPSHGAMSNHATHIVSTIFGQHPSEIKGWAPNCRGVNIPIFSNDGQGHITQIDLTRAIHLALDNGADIINISGGKLVKDKNETDLMLKKAVERCQNHDVLIVAAAGNEGCECLHIPASLQGVLAVGAMDDQGTPLDFSNWGGHYNQQGILAPGQNILGAQAGGGMQRLSGTSFATPLVSAVAALLLSIQQKKGIKPSPFKVREALIKSALPCDPQGGADCRKFLAGNINIQGAYALLFNGENLMNDANPTSETGGLIAETAGIAPAGLQPDNAQPAAQATAQAAFNAYDNTSGISASAACGCQSQGKTLVYALGKIGYDFGTEARRDSFIQLMQTTDGRPANPYDPKQMLAYLEQHPYESKMLIWTLNIDLTPIYAIEPQGPFERETYDRLLEALRGQIEAEDNIAYIERVSIPGHLTGKSTRLYSGQVVPVISAQTRGLYYWNVNHLIDAAVNAYQCSCTSTSTESANNNETVKNSLREFLNRIYYDYRNLGVSSSDRALNFAATNAFQATGVFAKHVAEPNGPIRQLSHIDIEKSPFCRMDSDCWDVKLSFFDPENDRRAMKIVRYTIDVSDVLPVTIGEPKSWSQRGN